MAPARRRLALAACLWALAVPAAWSQSASRGFLMVQRIDEVLYGVDPLATEVRGRDHVAGLFARVNVQQPSPILGYLRYVVDCRPPLRMAIVSSSTLTGRSGPDGAPEYREYRAEKTGFDELAYEPVHMLNGTQLVAEFACRSSAQPGRAAQIAQELYERGGPPDMQSLRCDLRPDGASQVVRQVEVRYSESAQLVSVNRQWLRTGTVTPREVRFGSGADEWRISRSGGVAQLVSDTGAVLYSGVCGG